MKILKFEDRETWLNARQGKITGTRLKDIIVKRGTEYKIGFYELIAEKIGVVDTENPMDRGIRLEEEAIGRFTKETGKKVDTSLVIWARDDNENIAVSPDGRIGKTEAVEAKCLSSARHIEAYLKREIPKDLEMQTIQYFIVNELLKKLHVVFYDPRIPALDYFVIEVNRTDKKEEIEEYLDYQKKTLEEVEKVVLSLTF